ncbi:MAG: DUF4102 domain-containing protein [Pusillimonas sp.]|nr:MAG: DUF4102 domain-containing protein [Pusillimonas sp.]
MTLGDVTTLTLRAARDRAAKIRIQVREGRDPRVVRAKKTAADLAWLQSHGVAGVQDKHYDANNHLKEKRRALELLYRLLERGKAKVVPLKDGV